MPISELALELASKSPWDVEDVQAFINRAVQIQVNAGLDFNENLIRVTFQVMLDMQTAGTATFDLKQITRFMGKEND